MRANSQTGCSTNRCASFKKIVFVREKKVFFFILGGGVSTTTYLRNLFKRGPLDYVYPIRSNLLELFSHHLEPYNLNFVTAASVVVIVIVSLASSLAFRALPSISHANIGPPIVVVVVFFVVPLLQRGGGRRRRLQRQ